MRAHLRTTAAVLASIWVLHVAACSEPAPLSAAERGRRAYLANCAVCHNPDPAQPGSQGPPIAGASRALVDARVVRGEYPPGYTPQRPTHIMPAQPLLAAKVDDLAAFLAAAATPH